MSLSEVTHERAIDELRSRIQAGDRIAVLSSMFSLFAFAELKPELIDIERMHLLLKGSSPGRSGFRVNGGPGERSLRNVLNQASLARDCAQWVSKRVDVRLLDAHIEEAWIQLSNGDTDVVLRGGGFTAEGLGIVPSEFISFVTTHVGDAVADSAVRKFSELWESTEYVRDVTQEFLARLDELARDNSPEAIYLLVLHSLFRDFLEEADADRILRGNTGFHESVVWNKLYKFQKDGVLGAIEKLERHNGCIIADSVGLGKTFEALAVIKYYELRNDRVLVLAPKRLRDNWEVYTQNDKRNILLADRFNFDVLHHTDLTRTSGTSGSINLQTLNWENYDLVVIDESHNFRNNPAVKGRKTRYEHLMADVLQAGVKTKVLMLSATPVNTRMTDLKNQVLFATEGHDDALAKYGIKSIEASLRKAQAKFNAWLKNDPDKRTAKDLVQGLGLEYVRLLDLLTIARSRKHIVKYYGTADVGEFPTRLTPITEKPDLDIDGELAPIAAINGQIERLNLAAYKPLTYVLPVKRAYYEALYDKKLEGSGARIFRQVDRETSLIHLMRINMLKRLESSVSAFTQTVEALLALQTTLLGRIAAYEADPSISVSLESFDDELESLDFEDPVFEDAAVGNKVKVMLADIDITRWKQELTEDRDGLATLLADAKGVGVARDGKLARLKQLITTKAEEPFNDGNRKVLVFTAFSDTAEYLYDNIAQWALDGFELHSALVTGGRNATNHPTSRKDSSSILINFSPISKERAVTGESNSPEIDIVIATDTISEGQNLQDCDTVINYDIHWNPVRIIQRFGRVDRLGSKNKAVQLVNFMPNMELDEYIRLEARVGGRMVLLDISATGEENVLEETPEEHMNDLAYRRRQLEQLQKQVLDMEDLSDGINITDLTLNDFRMDIVSRIDEVKKHVRDRPLGLMAAITLSAKLAEDGVKPGAIFLLKNVGSSVAVPESYPMAPLFLIYVSDDGELLAPVTEPKLALDVLRSHSLSVTEVDAAAADALAAATGKGRRMGQYRGLLESAVRALAGANEESKAASLFSAGPSRLGSAAKVTTVDDFEVIAWFAVLPSSDA